jgi:uncharacterized membrane protein YcaP (DUF421 family)
VNPNTRPPTPRPRQYARLFALAVAAIALAAAALLVLSVMGRIDSNAFTYFCFVMIFLGGGYISSAVYYASRRMPKD